MHSKRMVMSIEVMGGNGKNDNTVCVKEHYRKMAVVKS